MDRTLAEHIALSISQALGEEFTFVQRRSLSGGCINQGMEFITNRGSFFVKINSATRYPGMFEAEARGLNILASTKTIRIPEVICSGVLHDTSFLVLEFINSSSRQRNFWIDFGQKLAHLHQHTQHHFGLDHHNYIGSIPQDNSPAENWTEFYITRRFMPLVQKALTRGLLSGSDARLFEKLYTRLEKLYPHEPPALLHGDLWGGNVMTDEHGLVCLIDPAVYYGHREMDIAFSTLFGAFDPDFYDTYNEIFPLEPQWQKRIDLWNIYPLLVHLLLFGSSYYGQLMYAVKKYV